MTHSKPGNLAITAPDKQRNNMLIGVLFTVVCLTWGTTWIGIKIAVETVPPILASGLRFLIAFPIFLAFAKLKKAPLRFPKEERLFFILIVFIYFSLPYLLINVGEQYVSSGLTALLFSSMPVFVVIFSSLILHERIRILQMVGIAIGFMSLFMILEEHGAEFGYKSVLGVIAILTAAVMHALCYVITKKRGSEISIITFNTLPIGIAGALLTTLGMVVEHPYANGFSLASICALAYLGVVASVGGFLAYFHLLKRISPVALSFVFIIFPVIALVLGSWYEGRPISLAFVFYCSLLLLGFAMTKLSGTERHPIIGKPRFIKVDGFVSESRRS